MIIRFERFETGLDYTSTLQFFSSLQGENKTQAFSHLYGGELVELAGASYSQAKRKNYKYHMTYIGFEPTLNHDIYALRECDEFLKGYLGVEIVSEHLNAVYEQVVNFNGYEKRIFHIFIPEVMKAFVGGQIELQRVFTPHITSKRLEVAERFLEIHMRDGLRSGDHDDYVIRALEGLGYYSEAELVSQI